MTAGNELELDHVLLAAADLEVAARELELRHGLAAVVLRRDFGEIVLEALS